MNALSYIFRVIPAIVLILYFGLSSDVLAQNNIQISPANISAGNGQELTITGNGFGAGPAGPARYVEFLNADNGGAGRIRPELSQYVSWSNTQIVVKVPSGAGTGEVRVVVPGQTYTSSINLVIPYNLINVSGGFPKRHATTNDKGGLTFQYENKFYNETEARNSFTKSLKAWSCVAGINWSLGDPVSTDVTGKDGINVVRFDGGELPDGVLGVAYTYSVDCGNDNWKIVETDIVFDKSTDWNFGEGQPSNTQIDFQSVAMHELGHAHNLGHVIDDNDLMHYSTGAGISNRDLTAGNINAATFQMDINIVAAGGTCTDAMTRLYPVTCPTPFPIITSFSPVQAGLGDKVKITGKNLTGTTLVTFGRTSAASFVVESDESIEAVLGTGFTGEVTVETPGGVFSKAGFTFIEDPVLSAFNPAFGFTGDTITITGNHLQTAKEVRFGSTLAASFKVISNQEVRAVVGNGATGNVEVTTIRSTATKPGFTFTQPVRITSLVPAEGKVGDTILINGGNFRQVTSVKFGNKLAASFTVLTENQILAVLSDGNSGTVEVKTDIGTTTFNGFKFYGVPGISSFTPDRAAIGSTVSIRGANFLTATSVTFGDEPAKSFKVESDELITAVLGKGRSGAIKIKARGGEGLRDGFIFVETLHISGIAPVAATTNDTVLISGTNFKNVSAVSFGGVAAKSFQVRSTELIAAVVGAGNNGSVSVRTGEGVVNYQGFRFVEKPTIAFYTPASAGTGKVVAINGTNFKEITSVKFGGVEASSFKVISETFMEAVVGNGASGMVSVRNVAAAAESPGFIFIPAPVVNSVDPALAGVGTIVNIYGQNLNTVTGVKIGDRAASSFQVISATHITAIVATGTVGSGIQVSTTGGAVLFQQFRVVYPPSVSDFSPRSGIAGTEIAITGTGLNDVSGVMFGGVPAASFKVISAEQITAVVAAASKSGAITLSNIAGSSAVNGFDFKFTLPVNNFNLLVTDLTCRNAANGMIRITAQASLNYTATISGSGTTRTANFNSSVELKNLSAGTYTICVTIDDQPVFRQCFETIVRQPDDLSLISKINESERILSLSMTGGDAYFVELNGKVQRITTNQIDLSLSSGENKVKVYTDQVCQGVVEKTFTISDGIRIFPNPVQSLAAVRLPAHIKGMLNYQIMYPDGRAAFSGRKSVSEGMLEVETGSLAPGHYIVVLSNSTWRASSRMIKN